MTIIGLLGGPVIKGLIEAYRENLKAKTADAALAKDLAAKEIAAQTVETQAIYDLRKAQIGHPWEPEKLAFYIVLFYMGKVMIWDASLGLGTTDAVRGDVAVWAMLVVTYYFGKRGFENVARILRK